ncbi:MAG: hypothetical protein ACKVP0_02670 [Pirellulaceae bacterium]
MTPVQAMFWQIWRGWRWGLIASGAYLLVAAIVAQLLPAIIRNLSLGDEALSSAGVKLAFPGFLIIVQLIAAFSLTGAPQDLKIKGYSPRMFVMPVRTRTLVAWPMLWGSFAVAGTWLFIVGLILRPTGNVVPLFWPIAALAVFMTLLQALQWLPLEQSWLGIILAVPLVLFVGIVAVVVLVLPVPEPLATGIFLAMLPLTVAGCFHGVALARRGDTYDWHAWNRFISWIAQWRQPALHPFRSAERAQLWFECRSHAWSLPLFVAILAPFFAVMVLLAQGSDVIVSWKQLAMLVLMPASLALFIGGNMGNATFPFLATRPVSSPALVRGKLVMALVSTLMAYVPVLPVVPLFFIWQPIRDSAAENLQMLGPTKATAVMLHAALLPVLLTWKGLVETLWIGLTGRPWLLNSIAFGFAALFGGSALFGVWVTLHPEWQPFLWSLVPWLVGLALALKLLVAAWVLRSLVHLRLVTPQRAALMVVAWTFVVLPLGLLAAWLVPEKLMTFRDLLVTLVLFIPFSRLAGAPLALEWNRHR